MRVASFKGFGMNPRVEIDGTYLDANFSLQMMVTLQHNVKVMINVGSNFLSEKLCIDEKPLNFETHHLNEISSQ